MSKEHLGTQFDSDGLSRVRFGKARTTACLVGLALGVSPALYPYAEGLSGHNPTAQEQTIATAIDDALLPYGRSNTRVNCVSKVALSAMTGGSHEPAGIGLPNTRTIWLNESTCDGLTERFQQSPPTASDLERTQGNSASDISTVLQAVYVASHEAGHAQFDTANEPKAECIAFQLGPDVAVALGMDPTNKLAMRKALISQQTAFHTDPKFDRYHFDLERCRAGGADDLTPTEPNIFPTQP